MKFTFRALRILCLGVLVLVLFSLAAAAQTIPFDDARNHISHSVQTRGTLSRLQLTSPLTFVQRSSAMPFVPSAGGCAALLSLNIPDTEISSAQLVPADPDSGLPEYCDVSGFTDQTIGFDVRMPTEWNGKMYFAGNRGFGGHIRYDTSEGLSRSYATVSTDTGHHLYDILDASWALNNRPAEISFGITSVHSTTRVGKLIISSYYGSAPKFSYFDGCSTGGGQSLREAELYPEDFDGFVAGDPVSDFTGALLSLNWKMQAIQATDTSNLISLDKLYVIGNAVLEQCDAIDGLKDGLIEDPRKCNFDPVSIQCKHGDGPNCLTAAETHALQLIYQGPRTSSGLQIFPGLVKGGETPDGAGNGDGWDGMLSTPDGPSIELILQDQFLRYMAFRVDNPNYDWTSFNYDADPQKVAFMAGILNSTSTDLSRFQKLGRKLIMYHGWSDETVSPLRTLEYYDDVRNRLGAKHTSESIRLFMAPGMYHCGTGPGPDTFDYMSALEQWVEKGVPPEQMESTHFDLNGNADRTRPLCAYPKFAHYNGSGSIDDAANFSCVAPADSDGNRAEN
jgi:feruloyl esterase